jgi:hypothetical protein
MSEKCQEQTSYQLFGFDLTAFERSHSRAVRNRSLICVAGSAAGMTRSRGAVTRDLAKPTEETAGKAGRHEPTSPNFAQLRASSRMEESRALQSVDD